MMDRLKRFTALALLAVLLLMLTPGFAEEGFLEEEILLDETDPDAGSIAEETVAPDARSFTPAHGSPYEGQDPELNYWTLPMDITDEAAVWEVLMKPITVLNGKSFGQPEKAQIVLREEPDEAARGLGVCTCETQGVHVLKKDGDWALIECYSSSFHNSKVVNWNTLIQGWVPSKYLKEITPNQSIGFVVDKLTQRLYVFREGKLFTTLLVSTGVANPSQPYNETRSGEFLLTSKVGNFASDNMTCRMALRFNSGDLLHEVPYVYSRTDAGYKKQEVALGTRASHGCIRVQRKKTPEGINMQWIYEHHKKNTKFLVWEDWQGRQIAYPDDGTLLYYNPNKGEYYHSQETCYSTKKKFETFTYGELDEGDYAKLERCPYCTPPIRKAEIDAINELHAFGGDRDPVLTEARLHCPMELNDWTKLKKQIDKELKKKK